VFRCRPIQLDCPLTKLGLAVLFVILRHPLPATVGVGFQHLKVSRGQAFLFALLRSFFRDAPYSLLRKLLQDSSPNAPYTERLPVELAQWSVRLPKVQARAYQGLRGLSSRKVLCTLGPLSRPCTCARAGSNEGLLLLRRDCVPRNCLLVPAFDLHYV